MANVPKKTDKRIASGLQKWLSPVLLMRAGAILLLATSLVLIAIAPIGVEQPEAQGQPAPAHAYFEKDRSGDSDRSHNAAVRADFDYKTNQRPDWLAPVDDDLVRRKARTRAQDTGSTSNERHRWALMLGQLIVGVPGAPIGQPMLGDRPDAGWLFEDLRVTQRIHDTIDHI